MTTEELKAKYEEYIEYIHELLRNQKPFDGLLGFGKNPSKDDGHGRYYEEIKAMVEELAASSPSAEDAMSACEFIITARELYPKEDMASWTFTACEGLIELLTPFLTAEDAKILIKKYNHCAPRLSRLPVQKKAFAALKAAAGK